MKTTEDPILDSKITLKNRPIWFGSIELYRDGIVITGWNWTGRVVKRIPAENIVLVEKWTISLGPNFRIHTSDQEEPIFGRVHKGAKFWELALQKHRRIDIKLRH